jgi:DNA invertase Pin-like site-specific DNA recombinase
VKAGSKKIADPNSILHIYTRVSSMAQANEGTSLTTQHQLGVKKAKQIGFTPKHWDEGGKSSHHEDINGRPVLLKLYEAMKRGEVKHLWVYDQSRLSRNDQVASIFRYECNKQGVTLYTKDGQFNLSNPQDKLMKVILDGMGEFENSIRAERTRLGKLNRAREGFWFGGPPPFGYKITDKKLVLNKDESVWVKKVFTETAKGASTLEVKRMLDSNGVLPRRRANTWSIGSIQALLKNTHYKGSYHYHDKKSDEKIETECPAIVDQTTWTAVQKLKARKTSRVSQQNRTKQLYLLRDLMVCGHCGRPMSARRKLGKSEQLYYCPNKERDWVENGGTKTPWKRGEGCGMSRSLNIPETDKLVWESVIETHRSSSILKEEVKWKILEESGAPVTKSEAELKTLERQIKHLQKILIQAKESQAELLLNNASGKVKAEIYKIALEKSDEEIHNLDVKIANIQLQLKGGNENRKWVDWLRVFGQTLDGKKTLSDEEKKQYLTGLIEAIKVKYDEKKNEHELSIQFQLPIVGDGIQWKNPAKKKEGYKIKKGKQTTTVVVKKKDPRWSKTQTKVTPLQKQSVTVE